MSERVFDVLVLGGGSAGTAAASAAHAAGARTAMFNDGELGGLCILMGCMPTKTILHAAHLVHEAAHHHTPGVGHAALDVDFPAVMENKRAKVERFKRAKVGRIERDGYTVVDARAWFTGPDTVAASDGTTYRFTRGAVIATGSQPNIPPLPGLREVEPWTSDDVLRLERVPRSALVLGSGAIGLELAQFLARMGCAVTLVSRRRLLADSDPLLGEELTKALAAEPGLEVVAPCRPQRIERVDGGVRLHGESDAGAQVLTAEQVVAATGRRPWLHGLGLDAAGVAHGPDGVVHDHAMQTSNPRVFVAGDATGTAQLLHVANQEGRAAGLGAAGVPGDHRIDRRLHMEVVFTDPPLALLGRTELQARGAGLPVVSAVERFAETGRAITMDVQHGVWKLVAHAETGEILGTQILGPRADDLVHVVSAVMHFRGTGRDLLAMPWYHPTLSEVLLSLARGVVR
ncbi:MAG: FAD-dependent oxidoreductase [Planctomycetes bacterium]|nr:FAD-dependent oxidoreductase [Planctomycetota bacterium]